LLLKWDAKQHASDLILGYFALTLGLLARAGPFFILPALLLVLKRRSDKRSFLLQTGALLSVAGLAFAISRAYQARLAGPDSLPFSNFAYTLYGVARGGKGWIYSTQVLPHSTPQLVYQSAIDSIRHEPHLFALGALKGLWDFFLPNLLCATGFACRIVPSKLQPLVWLLTQVGFLVGLWALIRKKTSVGSSSRDLYLSGMLGLILSVPFAPPIDADLMRAHTMAIPLIAIVTALGIETIVRRLAASSLGPALARLAEPARELSVRAERRIFESFPYVVLFLVLAFVIRPLARSVRMDASVSGTGELAAQGHRTRPTDTGGCSGAQSYPVTLDHVMDGPLIDSVERVERLLGRSRLSPALLQPLKPVFQRVGIFEFAYAFVRETGNTWAVLLPRQIMARSFDGHESVSVCAEEVDAPLTQDGQLRALLITTTR
jgi:hypothetical protein